MSKKVLILGGGVGGMTAAHELVERGFEVHIHEQRPIPGGKARTIYVPGTGVGGRPDLPGEHGFRFFPGFYKHLPDTMRRIPYRDQAEGVAGNLVQATEYLMATAPDKNLPFLVKLPGSLLEIKEAFLTYFSAKGLDLPHDELAYFVDRLLLILTSCQERRLAEYEKITWWDFISASRMSPQYQLYLAKGLTRALVAMRAEEASTRTVGDILLQLLLGVYAPFTEFDRVLNGPTSEVWLTPWLDYLNDEGAQFHFESTAKEIRFAGGRITGVVFEGPGGVLTEHHADHYVAALPVEQLFPLITPAMMAHDPALARLGALRMAWMNGLQIFLRDDNPIINGHINFVDEPWALTAISQAQFWAQPLSTYGDGSARGCLSIDISDWETPGVGLPLPARDAPTREAVADEVRLQIKKAIRPDLASIVDDANVHSCFLDPDIVLPNPTGTTNLEPLLINTVDSWKDRPEAATGIDNLFLAADYVRTYTDLATMEGANEAARRAVNSLLARAGVHEPPCHLWPLEEPAIFLPLVEYDKLRFKLGLPHAHWPGSEPPPVAAPHPPLATPAPPAAVPVTAPLTAPAPPAAAMPIPESAPAPPGAMPAFGPPPFAAPVAVEDAATQGEPPPVPATPAPAPAARARHPRTESVAAIVAQTKG